MVGLVDLAPATEKVAGVTVYGVSARGLVHILNRFPELRALMTGRDVDAQDLIKLAPDALATIIAAGLGKPGDEEEEAAADRLPVELQVEFLDAILRLTMPNGFGPFVEKLTHMGSAFKTKGVAEASTKEPHTTSRKRSKR